MFPPGVYINGIRQDSVKMPNPPPLCRKQFSEFKHRRSIKDMFSIMNSRRPASSQQPEASSPPSLAESPKPLKRGSESNPSQLSPSRAETKKAKTTPSNPQPKSKKSTGQQSLKGFFAPKISKENYSPTKENPYTELTGSADVTNGSLQKRSSASQTEEILKEEVFIDPIEAKEKWGRLFAPRPPPKCSGHNENCIQLTTKKPGINNGRAFWMCARYVPFLTPLWTSTNVVTIDQLDLKAKQW